MGLPPGPSTVLRLCAYYESQRPGRSTMRPRILWLAAAIFALWVRAGAAMAGDFTNRHASGRRTGTVEQINGDH